MLAGRTHGPEVLLAGEKRTTAQSLPALPEMRPAAIWHEGIQLILLTFPLGNKCLEIVWPQAFDQRKIHSQKEPPAPIRQIRGLGARNRGDGPKDQARSVRAKGTADWEARQRHTQSPKDSGI